MATVRLDGRPVRDARLAALAKRIAARSPRAPPPALVSVHRGLDTPFRNYLGRQRRGAEELGIRFRDQVLAPDGGAEGLQRTLTELGVDPDVHGVLVEHPLPEAFDFANSMGALPVAKDIDGVSPESLGRLVAGSPSHLPAVARAALAIARYYGIRLEGERVAVIGRSPTVGLPLALLLLAKGEGTDATVTVAHSKSRDLAAATRDCSVVFSGVGRPNLLDRRTVPEGAAVIDVGLTTVPDPAAPSGTRIVGDANAPALEGWARALTPVPGGVGPVTVAELMAGVVDAWSAAVAKERWA